MGEQRQPSDSEELSKVSFNQLFTYTWMLLNGPEAEIEYFNTGCRQVVC